MYRKPKLIKCPKCGTETRILEGPILMVIPNEGVICKRCGYVVIHGSNAELSNKNHNDNSRDLSWFTNKILL